MLTRILIRTLVLLALAFALSGLFSRTASASSVNVPVSIAGAGTVTTPATSTRDALTCEQKPPVSNAAVFRCPGSAWRAEAPGNAEASLPLTPVAAPGWTFEGWTNCAAPYGSVTGTVCTHRMGDGSTLWTAVVTARFVDRTPPEAVEDLEITSSSADEGAYVVTWKPSEAELRTKCSVDGATSTPCTSPYRLGRREGEHTFTVVPIDPSDNTGAPRIETFEVVDTVITDGPKQGTEVRSAAFSAASAFPAQIECSLDGAAYRHCGSNKAGAATPLTLPDLADGRHTLLVRARHGFFVDLFPASRTFTIDTTAPQTFVQEIEDGIELSATEAGAKFRCRIDGGGFEDCASPYRLPDLAPGKHALDVVATDRAGNADATAARLRWTVEAPPAPAVAARVVTTEPAPASALVPAARSPLALTYTFRKGRFTRLEANQPATVTLKLPHRRAATTTLARLVGRTLPNGTKITVRAGADTRTLTIRGGKVRSS